jgi:hypothetical protein
MCACLESSYVSWWKSPTVTVSTFCSLCTSGVVRLHINSWLEVSFCLPHKIHYAASSLIPPEAIERSLKAIR